MRHIKINKTICSLLVCSMVIASGAGVFAGENPNLIDHMKSATLAQNTVNPVVAVQRHGGLKAVVDKLVEEGKLTREKADAIQKYMEQKREEQKDLKDTEKQSMRKGSKYRMIRELVDAKIITENEAEAIKSKLREIKEQALNEKLGDLTKKGVITQPQADKVKIYFEKAREERREQFKNVKNMTEEQRKAFFEQHKKDSPLVKLVNDGVLTKEQAEELHRALKEGHKENCKDH